MGVFKSVHYWFSLHLIIGKPFSLIYYMINFFLPILIFAEFNNNFNKFFVTSMQLVLISRLVIIAWKWLAILQSTRFHFPLLYFLWPCSSSHWGSLRAKESELVFTTGFGSLRWAKNKLYLLGSWNLVQLFWWNFGIVKKKNWYHTENISWNQFTQYVNSESQFGNVP